MLLVDLFQIINFREKERSKDIEGTHTESTATVKEAHHPVLFFQDIFHAQAELLICSPVNRMIFFVRPIYCIRCKENESYKIKGQRFYLCEQDLLHTEYHTKSRDKCFVNLLTRNNRTSSQAVGSYSSSRKRR